MAPIYSYSPKTTSISFPWPAEVTGLERIVLSAQGDLQRVLSAFFARPISVDLVYSHSHAHLSPGLPPTLLSLPNPKAIAAASPEAPISQTRQVRLQCSGRTVCTATSTVRLTSPRCAHLFLEEKYAIGQMFRKLEKLPTFELLAVGLGVAGDLAGEDGVPSKESSVDRKKQQQLWRRYKLIVPEFECEILEVFPSREMFSCGEDWLTDKQNRKELHAPSYPGLDVTIGVNATKLQSGVVPFLVTAFLLVFAFELSVSSTASRSATRVC